MNRRDTALRYFDENRDFMESYVNAQIEQNRKGTVKVSVKDKDGNPVSGAKIKIKQKNHEFRYGANIFMLDELETDEKNNDDPHALRHAAFHLWDHGVGLPCGGGDRTGEAGIRPGR